MAPSSLPLEGRGTSKLPIVGAVERGGRVVAQPSIRVDAHALTYFLNRHVDPNGSVLITDEYPAYRPMRRYISHVTINHSVRYAGMA